MMYILGVVAFLLIACFLYPVTYEWFGERESDRRTGASWRKNLE